MATGTGGASVTSFLNRIIRSEWIPPGLFFIAVGLAALWISRDYPLGDINRMGPGYFPRMLSIGMIGLGVLIVLRGLPDLRGDGKGGQSLGRGFWLVILSVAVFGLTVERLGLVVAMALSLAIAGAAHHEARVKEVAISIVVLIALAIGIFVVLLNLPLHLWPEL
jgi:hypothetical protein